MKSLKKQLTEILAAAFTEAGYDAEFGAVDVSSRPDLAQFQCNGAMRAAKVYKKNPRQIAREVVEQLQQFAEDKNGGRQPALSEAEGAVGGQVFEDISLAGPGFINLTLNDDFLTRRLQAMADEPERLGYEQASPSKRLIVDYGGANVAKPMHVGHLRAAIIGESLKRLARFKGYEVWGDIHMGDWGLQMGQVITEVERSQPELPYFDESFSGPYPAEAPFTIESLEEIYPRASKRCKADEEAMQAARQATYHLQQGRPGYRALWQHIVDVSVAALKVDYAKLNVEFDLWLGESDVQDRISPLVERLIAEGFACKSQGATIIDVSEADDKNEIPPLILLKSDGAVLYGTTDLATIDQRVQDYQPDLIWYVVDRRQANHFRQVFRAAYKTGVAPRSTGLEHTGFGTMNGKDGRPFKTREGGVMKLNDLIKMVTDKAQERMDEADVAKDYSAEDKAEIARIVGLAALKFADLGNHRVTDYIFDLDRFSAFEGRTGPYLLYTTVRTKSILRQAARRELLPGPLLPPAGDVERDVLLKIAELPNALDFAFETRAPNHLCEYAYALATVFNRFYRDHHILTESDADRQASWLGLSTLTVAVMTQVLDLLGIEVPERM